MNTDITKGKIKQFKGDVQAKWGRITDDDFDKAQGNETKLLGVIQQKYGYTKQQAQQEWDKFKQKIAA